MRTRRSGESPVVASKQLDALQRGSSPVRLPQRITHTGLPPLKWSGMVIPVVFSGESPFRAPNGSGSLAVA